MGSHLEPSLDNILFFAEETEIPKIDQSKISNWLKTTIQSEGGAYNSINIIFCSDDFLLRLNKVHLNHDYFTDIITFQYEQDPIEGELYISVDRVQENAEKLSVPASQELHRVIIHGVLHMLGYGDKSEEEKILIRQKEDYYLKELL